MVDARKMVGLGRHGHVKDAVGFRNEEEEIFQTAVLQPRGILEFADQTAVEDFAKRVLVAKVQHSVLSCQILAVVILVVGVFVLKEWVQ